MAPGGDGGGRPFGRARGSGAAAPYAPADSQGNFLAVPDEDTTDSGHPRADFDDLEHDPSERRRGGPVADAVKAAGQEVRLFKWTAPLVVFALALLVQSMTLYTATLQLIARAHTTGADAFPRDAFLAWLGGPRGRPQAVGLLAGALPYVWVILVVVVRQDMRLWSRTLAVGAALAVLNSLVVVATVLPEPGGLGACQRRLNPFARGQLEAAAQPPWGLPEMLSSLVWVLWLWLQDLVFGMQRQRDLVCTSGFSGPSYLCALLCLSLYDASRAWVRKLKPQFRNVCHIVFAVVLSSIAITIGFYDIVEQRQYSMDVAMAFAFALLLYGSPVMAIISDIFLVSGSTLAEVKDQEGFDTGDVVVPPCCVPFCTLHGRYFLFTRSSAETEESWRLHQRAARETEERRLARDDAARQVEELGRQLKSLRQGALARERQEEAESHRRMAEQTAEVRKDHDLRVKGVLASVEASNRAESEAIFELEAKLASDEHRAGELQLRGERERVPLEAQLAAARREEGEALAALAGGRERAELARRRLRAAHEGLDGEGAEGDAGAEGAERGAVVDIDRGGAVAGARGAEVEVGAVVDIDRGGAAAGAEGDAGAEGGAGAEGADAAGSPASRADADPAAEAGPARGAGASLAEAAASGQPPPGRPLVETQPWYMLPSVQPTVFQLPRGRGRRDAVL